MLPVGVGRTWQHFVGEQWEAPPRRRFFLERRGSQGFFVVPQSEVETLILQLFTEVLTSCFTIFSAPSNELGGHAGNLRLSGSRCRWGLVWPHADIACHKSSVSCSVPLTTTTGQWFKWFSN